MSAFVPDFQVGDTVRFRMTKHQTTWTVKRVDPIDGGCDLTGRPRDRHGVDQDRLEHATTSGRRRA